MKKLLISLLLVASLVAIAAQKTFTCVECKGKKRVNYDKTFKSKCKTCKGKGVLTKKQLQKSRINIYVRKKITVDKNGKDVYSTVQVKTVSNAFANVYYDRFTKQFRIEQRTPIEEESENEFKSYERR